MSGAAAVIKQRAAMQPAEPCNEGDSAPAVQALAVLLKQKELVGQPMLCKLLACSNAVRRLVYDEFRGRLHISMARKEQQAAAGQQPGHHAHSYMWWLARHAQLLHTLTLTLSASIDEAAIVAGLDVDGLRAAAAAGDLEAAALAIAPAPLPLISLQCCSPISGVLLGAVASVSSPTSLLLTLEGGRKGVHPALSGGLASLTSLQHLQLRPAAATAYVSELGSALSSLTGLRGLQCSNKVLLLPAVVRLLPTSLQVLSLSCRAGTNGRRLVVRVDRDSDSSPDPPGLDSDSELAPGREWVKVCKIQALDLTPLSALTMLDLSRLNSKDKLPPSLQELRLTTPHSFVPVKQCSSLHTLAIKDTECLTPWDELQHVSTALKGLQSISVDLGHYFTDRLSSRGHFRAFVPRLTRHLHNIGNTLAGVKQLKQLRVKDFFLLPSFVKGLSRYSQLTHLSLWDCTLITDNAPDEITTSEDHRASWTKEEAASVIQALAASVQSLSQLRHLEWELNAGWMKPIPLENDQHTGWGVTRADLQLLVQAALGLPSVQRVYVSGGRLGPVLVHRKP